MKAPIPHSPRSNLPFVQDWPKSDFPDRNYARLKVARLEDRALLGSNPSARVGERLKEIIRCNRERLRVNYTGGARCYLAPFFLKY